MNSRTLVISLAVLFVGVAACDSDSKTTPPPASPGVSAPSQSPTPATNVSPSAPAAVAPTATAAADSPRFKEGDKVRVLWGGRWYPAEVLSVRGKDRFKIHYDNYGSKWDEVVGGAKIKSR